MLLCHVILEALLRRIMLRNPSYRVFQIIWYVNATYSKVSNEIDQFKQIHLLFVIYDTFCHFLLMNFIIVWNPDGHFECMLQNNLISTFKVQNSELKARSKKIFSSFFYIQQSSAQFSEILKYFKPPYNVDIFNKLIHLEASWEIKQCVCISEY